MPYISEQVVAAAATALGNQSTQGYLKNVYDGFNQIAQSNQKAATSAGQLADGTSAAVGREPPSSTPVPAASPGAWTRWPPGAASCSAGTSSVSTGSAEVASGASELAQGARKLHSGADEARAQQPHAGRTVAATSRSGPGRSLEGRTVVAGGAARRFHRRRAAWRTPCAT